MPTYTMFRIDIDSNEAIALRTYQDVDEAFMKRKIEGYKRVVSKVIGRGKDVPFLWKYEEEK